MTDIEQRARDALNASMASDDWRNLDKDDTRKSNRHIEAMCRQIEAHDATKAEFEDYKRDVSAEAKGVKKAIDKIVDDGCFSSDYRWHRNALTDVQFALSRFILPEPVDPLLIEARAICAAVDGENKGYQYLDGSRDDYPTMQVVLMALRKRDALTITEQQP